MSLEFKIATGSTLPIYRQLAEQVRKAVATGAMATGEQLPSVRALAERLVVNPNTVAKAYADLVQEGVLESHAGKGLFVAPRRQRLSHEERTLRLNQAVDLFLQEVLFLDFRSDEIIALLQSKLAELEPSLPAGQGASR